MTGKSESEKGLSAGKLLSEHGVDVIVLEAQDRVGGRTHTLRDESFGYTDVGGAYVGPTQRRVARMARELGLTFYKVNEDQKTILSMKGYFMKYKGTIPNFSNPVHALDMNHMQRLLQSMAETVPVEAPWKATHAEEWDSMTYQQFIDKHCWTQ